MTSNSSARFPFDIIGFDLDGTPVDTSGDPAAAVNHDPIPSLEHYRRAQG
jgi:phosphoglycolate phosphatase